MSLIAALSNARSGLAAAQQALNVTANNVANVNTPGYSRKIVQQETVVSAGNGAGARSLQASRAIDDFLGQRVREQQARLERSEVLQDARGAALDRVFGKPGETERGLSNRINKLVGLAQATSASGSAADKRALVSAARDVARAIEEAGAELQSLRRDADQKLARAVGEINEDVAGIDRLNKEISRLGAGAELLDKRDALIERLAGKIEVSVARDSDDNVSVYARGGHPLLDGGMPRVLRYEPAGSVGPDTAFGPIRLFRGDEIDGASGQPKPGAEGKVVVSGGVRASLTPELEADSIPDEAQKVSSPFDQGRLQGLLEVRDGVLPGLADQLGELAGLLRHALNAAHNAAVALPPPDRLVGTRTDFGSLAGATRSGGAYLAVVDRASGNAAAVVRVDMATLGDPAQAASQITSGLNGFGAATVNGDGAIEIVAQSGYGLALNEANSAIGVVTAAGKRLDFGFSHYFGLNDLFVAHGPSPTNLGVHPALVADGGRLGQAQLDVVTTPALSAKLGGAGDHRGVRGLAAAFEREMEAAARGGLAGGDFRVADYAAEVAASAAFGAELAGSRAEEDRSLSDDLAARRANVAGVNLDEELSNMMIYQQAYSVSARMIAVVDELFDTLLAIGR